MKKRSHRFIDRTGQQFDYLTVIKDTGKLKHHCAVWLCRCRCGKIVERTSISLTGKSKQTKSCGCRNKELLRKRNISPPKIMPAGTRIGRWTVLFKSTHHKRVGGKPNQWWWCKCDCGVIREVLGYSLRSGRTQGCGCGHNRLRRLPAEAYAPGITDTQRRVWWNTDKYIKDLLQRQLNISRDKIPPELIEIKRALLLLRRVVAKNKREDPDGFNRLKSTFNRRMRNIAQR